MSKRKKNKLVELATNLNARGSCPPVTNIAIEFAGEVVKDITGNKFVGESVKTGMRILLCTPPKTGR